MGVDYCAVCVGYLPLRERAGSDQFTVPPLTSVDMMVYRTVRSLLRAACTVPLPARSR